MAAKIIAVIYTAFLIDIWSIASATRDVDACT